MCSCVVNLQSTNIVQARSIFGKNKSSCYFAMPLGRPVENLTEKLVKAFLSADITLYKLRNK